MAQPSSSLLLILLLLCYHQQGTAAPSKAPAPKLMLGRPGTNLKAGLVGLPNVGKSSFFNVLCSMQVAAENYPFCTIDPTVSRVEVQDERFEWLCEHYKPASRVPAFLQVTDIAGLVKGAAEGAGLGNAFLSHIQAVDCIFHVVRAFDDPDVTHVEDSVDPLRDLDIIAGELLRKDLATCKSRKEAAEKKLRTGPKAGPASPEQKEVDIMARVVAHLEANKPIRTADWTPAEVEVLNSMQLLTAKQCVLLVNLSSEDCIRKKNKWLPKIKEWVDAHAPSDVVVPISCVLEANLAGMTVQERHAFCEDKKVQSSLAKVVNAGLKALNMHCFFTAGSDEVRSWGIQVGTRAPQAAGVIHSDFEKGFIMAETMSFKDLQLAGSKARKMSTEKGFIMAETMSFKDLQLAGSEAALKSSGKYRMNGKDYVVADGDILLFKFNTPSKPKEKKSDK